MALLAEIEAVTQRREAVLPCCHRLLKFALCLASHVRSRRYIPNSFVQLHHLHQKLRRQLVLLLIFQHSCVPEHIAEQSIVITKNTVAFIHLRRYLQRIRLAYVIVAAEAVGMVLPA